MKLHKIVLALTLASFGLPAQTSTSSAPKKSSGGGDLFEVNLFAGGAFFRVQKKPPEQDQSNGGIFGARVSYNFGDHMSIEGSGMVHGIANTIYRVPNTANDYAFGTRLRQFYVNPVYHFKTREARVRPYVTAGFGMDYFGITEDARRQVGNGVNTPFMQLTNLESQFRLAVNYGAGVKAKLTDRVGLRFDVRGFMTDGADLGVKGSGPVGAILQSGFSPLHSVQTTGGVTFYMGAIDTGPVCEFRVGSIDPATKTVWLGEGASYQLPVTNNCLGVTPKYKWTLNGQPLAGDSMAAVNNAPVGEHQIKGIVEADITKITDRKTRNYLKKFPIPATERTASLTVKQPTLQLVSLTVDPSTINYNGTS
ncbi:MAG: outer membrane beta-barrel protein, partial [Chloroflexia bacterium]